MFRTYYVALDHENYIQQLTDLPFEGSQALDIRGPLPPEIAAGCYRVVHDQPVYVKERDRSAIWSYLESLARENAFTLLELAKVKAHQLTIKEVASVGWKSRIASYYGMGLYDKDQVKVFVAANHITADEYEEITGDPYTALVEMLLEEE